MTGEVISKWGELTDDKITQAQENRDNPVGKIQERYGIAKDETERQVDESAAKAGTEIERGTDGIFAFRFLIGRG